MSGLPEFNYPAFMSSARALRSAGYRVLNPAETQGQPDSTWEWWMRQALAQVLRAEGVALLDGWRDSRGARLEHTVATSLGIECHPVAHWLDLRMTGPGAGRAS
jgi:hypothetical protein